MVHNVHMDEEKKKEVVDTAHYYGDIVRRYFLLGGAVLLLAILVDRESLTFYLFTGVFGVLALTVLAGLTSPLSRQVTIANGIVSGALFLVFEYFAVNAYLNYLDFFNETFLLRQILALIFIIALYFSTKTFRGMVEK